MNLARTIIYQALSGLLLITIIAFCGWMSWKVIAMGWQIGRQILQSAGAI